MVPQILKNTQGPTVNAGWPMSVGQTETGNNIPASTSQCFVDAKETLKTR